MHENIFSQNFSEKNNFFIMHNDAVLEWFYIQNSLEATNECKINLHTKSHIMYHIVAGFGQPTVSNHTRVIFSQKIASKTLA